jgi:HD-like signal output (HDOD) protein
MASLSSTPASLNLAVPAAEAYVQQLLGEISGGHVELPTWSNQTEQVRTALDSDTVGIEEIARLLARDAGLAVRVLAMANSALFARTTRPLMDLRLAVLRLGLENVRGAVYAHALAQLRRAPKLAPLRAQLAQLAEESASVAALTRLIAQQVDDDEVSPAQALLAGLLHNIGKLYLLVRMSEDGPALDRRVRDAILNERQASIGQALAASWNLPAPLCQAIAEQRCAADTDLAGRTGLSRVLSVAITVSQDSDTPEQTAEFLADTGTFQVDVSGWLDLLNRAREQRAGLNATFGD